MYYFLRIDDESASKNHLSSIVSRYMEGRFKIEMKNLEFDAEPVSVTNETFLQVILFLFLFVHFYKERNNEIVIRWCRLGSKCLVIIF